MLASCFTRKNEKLNLLVALDTDLSHVSCTVGKKLLVTDILQISFVDSAILSGKEIAHTEKLFLLSKVSKWKHFTAGVSSKAKPFFNNKNTFVFMSAAFTLSVLSLSYCTPCLKKKKKKPKCYCYQYNNTLSRGTWVISCPDSINVRDTCRWSH